MYRNMTPLQTVLYNSVCNSTSCKFLSSKDTLDKTLQGHGLQLLSLNIFFNI